MKTTGLKSILTASILSGVLIATQALAQGAPSGDGATEDTSGASQDYSRKEMAAAIINYDAAARVKAYQYNEQLLFMAAPGTQWALDAGSVVGASDTADYALSLSDKSLVNGLGTLTIATSLNVNGRDIPVPQAYIGPLQYYQTMQNFFSQGDTTELARVNPGSVLLQDNLSKETPIVTEEQAQMLINVLTNPFPYFDPAIRDKIKNNIALSGAEMEALGNRLADYALIGVSTSAWGDIVARRLPMTGQTESVMEIMDKHSDERFVDPNWYKYIAAASDTALLREIAHMMAYNQWMAYQQFRVSEQQLALMATLNSMISKLNMSVGKLNQQMMASEAQAKAAQAQIRSRN